MSSVIQYVLYLAILVVLAVPLGAYIKKVMFGEKTFLSKILTPCENLVYSDLFSCFSYSFFREFFPEIRRIFPEHHGILDLTQPQAL